MEIKRALVLLTAIIACYSYIFAHDHIILRNGQEYDVKLYQITDVKIVFEYINGARRRDRKWHHRIRIWYISKNRVMYI